MQFVKETQTSTVQKLWDRHPNTIELASWLVHVVCDFKATWHQEALISFEYTMKIHLVEIFYLFGERPPSIFPSYVYLFFVIHFAKLKFMVRSVPVLKLPEKMYYSFFKGYICYEEIKNICRKNKHKSICIIIQLTTFYCYSATNSITNLSNK